jgi:hypothetical protein
LYEVAHSMIYMRMHEICGELVRSGVTTFVETSVDEYVCWVDTAVTGRVA